MARKQRRFGPHTIEFPDDEPPPFPHAISASPGRTKRARQDSNLQPLVPKVKDRFLISRRAMTYQLLLYREDQARWLRSLLFIFYCVLQEMELVL